MIYLYKRLMTTGCMCEYVCVHISVYVDTCTCVSWLNTFVILCNFNFKNCY